MRQGMIGLAAALTAALSASAARAEPPRAETSRAETPQAETPQAEVDLSAPLTVPLLAPPVEIAPGHGLYLHFGVVAALPSGRIVYAAYAGVRHVTGRPSNVVVSYTDDFGARWSALDAVCDGFTLGGECRVQSLGATAAGDLALIYLYGLAPRAGAPTEWALLQSRSGDGVSWSAPAPVAIAGGHPSRPTGSQLAVYGQFDRLADGRLLASAYLGPFNWTMESDDDGGLWRLRPIVDSRRVADLPADADLNELAIEPLDAARWVGVTRVNRARTVMRQFATVDGGARWRDLGPINTPLAGGYVSPSLDRYTDKAGRRWLILSMMSRRSRSLPADRSDALLFFIAPAEAALARADAWIYAGYLPGDESHEMRSGYPTLAIDRARGAALVVTHDEESEALVRAYAFQIDLEAMIGAALAARAR